MEKIKLKKLDNNQNFQESNGSISDFAKQNFLNSKNESQQLQNPKHLLNYKGGNQNQQQQNQNQGQNNRVLKQTVNMPLLKQKKQKPFQKEENLQQEKNQGQLEEVKLAKLVAGKKVQKTSLPIQNFDVPDFQLSMNFNSNYRPYSEDNVSNKKMMEKLREQAEIQEQRKLKEKNKGGCQITNQSQKNEEKIREKDKQNEIFFKKVLMNEKNENNDFNNSIRSKQSSLNNQNQNSNQNLNKIKSLEYHNNSKYGNINSSKTNTYTNINMDKSGNKNTHSNNSSNKFNTISLKDKLKNSINNNYNVYFDMGSKINEQTTNNELQNSSNNISNKNRRIKITYTYNQNENLGKTLINSNNSNINQIQQQKNLESENFLKLPKNINNLNNINNTNNSSNINSIRSKASSINSSVKNSPFKKSTQLEPVIYKNNYEKQVQRKDSQFLRAAIKEKKMQNSNQQNEENITNKKSYVAKFRNLFDEFEQNKNLNLKLLKIQSDNNAQQKEMDKTQNKQEQNQNQNLDQNKNQNNSQSYISQEKNEQSSTEKNQKQNKIQNKQLIKTVTKQLSISENEDMFPECSQISYILEDAENASQDLISQFQFNNNININKQQHNCKQNGSIKSQKSQKSVINNSNSYLFNVNSIKQVSSLSCISISCHCNENESNNTYFSSPNKSNKSSTTGQKHKKQYFHNNTNKNSSKKKCYCKNNINQQQKHQNIFSLHHNNNSNNFSNYSGSINNKNNNQLNVFLDKDNINKSILINSNLFIKNNSSSKCKSFSSNSCSSFKKKKNQQYIHKLNQDNQLNIKKKNSKSQNVGFDQKNQQLQQQKHNQYKKSFNSKYQFIIEENKEEERPSSVIQGNIMKWKIGDFIGAGTFGQVFRAMDINSGEIFAVKKIPLIGNCNQEFYEATEQELSLINNVNHKNVVKYYGHEKIEKNLCIYLEYMDAGNIQNIYQKFGALEEENIRLYTRQILQGLAYLHNKNIIHRDIKSANILVDNEGTVKLSDFGCAKQLEITLNSLSAKEDLNNTLKGSVPWMAPEVVKQTNYSFQADIWSFGCTILEMATGKLPWMQYNFEDPISAIMKIGISDEIPLIPENLGDSIKNFLKLCLNRDPEKRPSAKQLLEHQFIQI